MIIGVDFDGTISLGEWPECGPPNRGLIKYLNKKKAKGDKLILWTCREGEDLQAAVMFCRENGLEFDAVNDNVPEIIEKYGNNSRKITCDCYIDDRMLSKKIRKPNKIKELLFQAIDKRQERSGRQGRRPGTVLCLLSENLTSLSRLGIKET